MQIKRFLSFMLSVLLVVSLAIPAFASASLPDEYDRYSALQRQNLEELERISQAMYEESERRINPNLYGEIPVFGYGIGGKNVVQPLGNYIGIMPLGFASNEVDLGIEIGLAGVTPTTITIDNSFDITLGAIPIPPGSNITIEADTPRVLTVTDNFRHFYVQGILTLGSNITLTRSDPMIVGNSNGGGVHIANNGVFNMNDGVITNNRAGNGGGVSTGDFSGTGSIFNMNGGTISNNSSGMFGGGVHMASGSAFAMTGGTIANNTGSLGGGVSLRGVIGGTMTGGVIRDNTAGNGGGVYVCSGTFFEMSDNAEVISNHGSSSGGGVVICMMQSHFLMSGGIIEDNTSANGAGVGFFITGGIFEMSDTSLIYNNTASISGGGASIPHSTFIMNGGTIDNNAAGNFAGGVSVFGPNSTFTMHDGAITNNSAGISNDDGAGGGVYVESDSLFTMYGGLIENNTASLTGGGVNLGVTGTFNMHPGAIIRGNEADSSGGGISVFSANATINLNGGTIDDNIANRGGGISLTNGTINFALANTTQITNNRARLYGGGIFSSSNITITNAQITGNIAGYGEDGAINGTGIGGGIYFPIPDRGAMLTINDNVTFSGNRGHLNNSADDAFNDYGLAAGLAQYPNIRWCGYAAGSTSHSSPSHIINNWDVNHIWPTAEPQFINVNFWRYMGTNDAAPFATQTVVAGGFATPPTVNPVWTGFMFTGWSLEAEYPQLFNFLTPITGAALNFFGIWVPVSEQPPPPPITTPTPPEYVQPSVNITLSPGVPVRTPTPTPAPTPEPTPLPTPQPQPNIRHAFMVGYTDGTVRPSAPTTRAHVATIMFRFMSYSDRAHYWQQTNPFPDVSIDNWFNNAVSTTVNAGIIRGMPDGSFQPNRATTRAELVAAVVRTQGIDTSGDAQMFSDIAGHWAAAYINAAAAEGWLTGYDGIGGSFLPDQHITRAETAALVSRWLGGNPEVPEDLHHDMLTWVDNANQSTWYFLYIQAATNSYTYELKPDGIHATWLDILPARQWTLLERPYSRPSDLFR